MLPASKNSRVVAKRDLIRSVHSSQSIPVEKVFFRARRLIRNSFFHEVFKGFDNTQPFTVRDCFHTLFQGSVASHGWSI